MKLSKNSFALILIASCILLLLALQVFWLHSSYRNETSDLRKEANNILRNTVFQLRDSVFTNTIRPAMDSSVIAMSRITLKDPKLADTMFMRSSGMQVFISSTGSNDSLDKALQPFTQKLIRLQKGEPTFTIRIMADSIQVDTLTHYYQKNLREASIDVLANVDEVRFGKLKFRNGVPRFPDGPLHDILGEPKMNIPAQSLFSDTLLAEPVRLNPGRHYTARLVGVRGLMLKKITPQILFSVFLTLLTTAAFVIMYRSIRAQQRLMELKNDFISNITHELKTPITTVGVAIEALKDFKAIHNPALTNEYLGIAQNELNRLSILTDKILKTAIFENKGIEFRPEPIEMDTLIEQVLASMKLVFEKQEAKVTFDKQGNSFSILGGNVHLTSVVYNLLDNALKYSLINPEIHIQLNEETSQIILSVADNGIGIPPEYRKKVFEKFFRVPTGDVHNIKGYGLGLSYVESVVKSHHGSIELQSKSGNGSTFIIRLPKTFS